MLFRNFLGKGSYYLLGSKKNDNQNAQSRNVCAQYGLFVHLFLR